MKARNSIPSLPDKIYAYSIGQTYDQGVLQASFLVQFIRNQKGETSFFFRMLLSGSCVQAVRAHLWM